MTTHPGNPYDGSLLAEAKKRSEKNTRILIERMLVDRGFRGHKVKNGQVLISYTQGLTKHLKRALRRRQAIEPWIGHMKQEGKMDRCYLKGLVGDEIHACLVGIGHNFRTILKKLRVIYVYLLGWMEGLWLLAEREKDRLKAAGQDVVA